MAMTVRQVDEILASIDRDLTTTRGAFEQSAADIQRDGSNPRREELRAQIHTLEQRRDNAVAARTVAQRHEAVLRAADERRRDREAHAGAVEAYREGLGYMRQVETLLGQLLAAIAAAQAAEDRAVGPVGRRLGPERSGRANLRPMLLSDIDRLVKFFGSTDAPSYEGMTERAAQWAEKQCERIASVLNIDPADATETTLQETAA